MKQSSQFSEVLEATGRLSLEEKETLVEVLSKRAAEERRAQLKREIDQGRREYAAGKLKPLSTKQIMRDIRK